ncbi:MAG: O-antigen ligase family protein [Bacteroidetes bacterium]|nr:O-antigen ligase family protein [Bacteroidota bacterium]
MKLKTKYIIDKFVFFSLIFICLSIFLPPFFKSLAITFLALSTLCTFLTKTYVLKPLFDKKILLFLIFFCLHIIGVFYSSNKDSALFDLQIKLPMLILPLIFIFLPKSFITKDKLWQYALSIIAGLTITIFYCFSYGIVRAVSNSLPILPEIIYTKLSANFHPSYLSLFAAIGLVLTYKIPLKNIFTHIKNTGLIKSIIIVLISIFLIMLNSRTGFIVMVISYLWILIDMFFVSKRKVLTISTALIVSLSLVIVLSTDILSQRYNNAINNIGQNDNIMPEQSSMSQRNFIYSNSLNLISENIVFGVGTGDVKSTFEKLYERENVHFQSYLNAHNQYLQTTIALGLVGLLILLSLFFFPMIKMIKEKEFFLLTIFILIGFSFLFESMLERNMGTYFFALIYVLSISYLYNLIYFYKVGI